MFLQSYIRHRQVIRHVGRVISFLIHCHHNMKSQYQIGTLAAVVKAAVVVHGQTDGSQDQQNERKEYRLREKVGDMTVRIDQIREISHLSACFYRAFFGDSGVQHIKGHAELGDKKAEAEKSCDPQGTQTDRQMVAGFGPGRHKVSQAMLLHGFPPLQAKGRSTGLRR